MTVAPAPRRPAEPRTAGYRPPGPLDLAGTLGPLRRGTADPCHRLAPDGTLWRTFRAPTGAATLALTRAADGEVRVHAWGPGADWALAALPGLLGGRDDATGFDPAHRLVRTAAARNPGLRLSRCGLVFEVLVPAVLEQKVTGGAARSAWRLLLGRYGEPAPGPAPAGMRVCPPPAVWARVPSWDWHRAGVDGKRSRAVLAAAAVAGRLEETAALPVATAAARLAGVPGIGPWTVAEVVQRSHGCPDTVSVGDFHIPAFVGWALAGRPVDDAGMLELLEADRPHRQRVVRLLERSGFRKPRFGPRYAPQDLSSF